MSVDQEKINAMSFEESLKELEKIVDRLSTAKQILMNYYRCMKRELLI